MNMYHKLPFLPVRSCIFLIGFLLSLYSQAETKNHAISEQVAKTQSAHRIESWWEKEFVRAHVEIDFEGERMVDGVFTFDAHGPRARYDRRDGASIIFDGETAWISPDTANAGDGRFHVLTWPWFIVAPFKMQGEGIQLSEFSHRDVNGKEYATILQNFDRSMGDSPDDWYRFFINPENHLIDAMSYIVTYDSDLETANQKPSIIKYFDYAESPLPRVATRYEFWFWNPRTGKTIGHLPKGTGRLSNISYPGRHSVDFSIPKDARELRLPRASFDYSEYKKLLQTYVDDTGVDYRGWFGNKRDLATLDTFIEEASEVDLTKLSDSQIKAFYINLYNAAMLQAVFREYPLKSVKDIGKEPFSIFKKKFIRQSGRLLSLDDIEKGILLKEYFDPRIHFAVNCADRKSVV